MQELPAWIVTENPWCLNMLDNDAHHPSWQKQLLVHIMNNNNNVKIQTFFSQNPVYFGSNKPISRPIPEVETVD